MFFWKKDKSKEGESTVEQESQTALLLKELENWCKKHNKVEFYNFFDEILKEAKNRYQNSRGKAWSPALNFVTIIAFVVVPVAFSILTFFIEQYQNVAFAGKFVLLLFTSVVYFGLSIWLQWYQRKNAPETWVRRSAFYHRLSITLGVFVFSDQSMDDYKQLVKDTFAVLEQNIDQFTLNLSSNGLAEKP